jgi:hypothetical protein
MEEIDNCINVNQRVDVGGGGDCFFLSLVGANMFKDGEDIPASNSEELFSESMNLRARICDKVNLNDDGTQREYANYMITTAIGRIPVDNYIFDEIYEECVRQFKKTTTLNLDFRIEADGDGRERRIRVDADEEVRRICQGMTQEGMEQHIRENLRRGHRDNATSFDFAGGTEIDSPLAKTVEIARWCVVQENQLGWDWPYERYLCYTLPDYRIAAVEYDRVKEYRNLWSIWFKRQGKWGGEVIWPAAGTDVLNKRIISYSLNIGNISGRAGDFTVFNTQLGNLCIHSGIIEKLETLGGIMDQELSELQKNQLKNRVQDIRSIPVFHLDSECERLGIDEGLWKEGVAANRPVEVGGDDGDQPNLREWLLTVIETHRPEDIRQIREETAVLVRKAKPVRNAPMRCVQNQYEGWPTGKRVVMAAFNLGNGPMAEVAAIGRIDNMTLGELFDIILRRIRGEFNELIMTELDGGGLGPELSDLDLISRLMKILLQGVPKSSLQAMEQQPGEVEIIALKLHQGMEISYEDVYSVQYEKRENTYTLCTRTMVAQAHGIDLDQFSIKLKFLRAGHYQIYATPEAAEKHSKLMKSLRKRNNYNNNKLDLLKENKEVILAGAAGLGLGGAAYLYKHGLGNVLSGGGDSNKRTRRKSKRKRRRSKRTKRKFNRTKKKSKRKRTRRKY